jgi:hypothetical protein
MLRVLQNALFSLALLALLTGPAAVVAAGRHGYQLQTTATGAVVLSVVVMALLSTWAVSVAIRPRVLLTGLLEIAILVELAFLPGEAMVVAVSACAAAAMASGLMVGTRHVRAAARLDLVGIMERRETRSPAATVFSVVVVATAVAATVIVVALTLGGVGPAIVIWSISIVGLLGTRLIFRRPRTSSVAAAIGLATLALGAAGVLVAVDSGMAGLRARHVLTPRPAYVQLLSPDGRRTLSLSEQWFFRSDSVFVVTIRRHMLGMADLHKVMLEWYSDTGDRPKVRWVDDRTIDVNGNRIRVP